jgi:Kef-type K+ transport system membrane component KefB
MHDQSVVHIVFLIFTGTAILSTFALYTRQSLLVAYMLLGAMLGPWGLELVKDSALIKQTGDIGIIFLLFLLGLHLQPQNLLHSLRKMSLITLISSIIFLLVGFGIGRAFHFNYHRNNDDVFQYYYRFEIITYDYITSPAYR